MVLVQVAGRKILYSGDFRRTGRKSVLVDRMLASPPSNVDVLLLEGTTLGREESFPTESDLENQFIDFFRETKGRVFITFSAQNIDRLVTIYRACKQSRRSLVVDLYTIDVLEQLGRFTRSLPQLGWPNLWAVVTSRIKWLYDQADRLNRPAFVDHCCESRRAFGAANIENGPHQNVIMLRPSLFHDYVKKGIVLTRNDAWVFSMWSGYLEKPEYQDLRSAFEKAGAGVTTIPTSGHASRGDLQTFAAHISAKCKVPIHSFDWNQYTTHFDGVRRLQDGESLEIA